MTHKFIRNCNMVAQKELEVKGLFPIEKSSPMPICLECFGMILGMSPIILHEQEETKARCG